ncbi:MAG: hypothetical protein KJ718_03960 [Nanoarchaeota archaeon]|nr:hypothetical protein [Nanoarchaeota archaeon]MBU1051683.1 hypothetical protein [Nanoarchaeota archaeon]
MLGAIAAQLMVPDTAALAFRSAADCYRSMQDWVENPQTWMLKREHQMIDLSVACGRESVQIAEIQNRN